MLWLLSSRGCRMNGSKMNMMISFLQGFLHTGDVVQYKSLLYRDLYSLNLTLALSNSPTLPIPAKLHFSVTKASSTLCLSMPLRA